MKTDVSQLCLLSPRSLEEGTGVRPKIAVFRALQLGDMLCAIPALRALRQAYPDAEITLLGLPWAKTLVERFPEYLDDFMHFPGYPGLPEQPFSPAAFLEFLQEAQARKFDLVLQMQGNGSFVNPMVELLGAKQTAGFCLANDYAPDNGLFLEYPEGIHETERHLKLVQHLGLEATDSSLEFPLTAKDRSDLQAAGFDLPKGSYVCVHPGSRGAWRQWPVEYFAALGDACAEKGLTVVLTGTADEMPIVEAVAGKMVHKPVIAAGKTSLGTVGVLINDAALLISNCTGVSHIAAALQTPSIVMSMDGEPERWAPQNTHLYRTIDWTRTPDFGLAQAALNDLLETVVLTKKF